MPDALYTWILIVCALWVVHLGALVKLRSLNRPQIWRFLGVRLAAILIGADVVTALSGPQGAFGLAGFMGTALASAVGAELVEFKVFQIKLDWRAILTQVCIVSCCFGWGAVLFKDL